MDVGVVHFLPTGGALRVLSEWMARTEARRVVVYTRAADVHAFAPLPPHVEVVEAPLHPGTGMLDEVRRLASSPRDGARLAACVDAGSHDAVLCLPSRLTQAPDVLGPLATPSLYYAPEPMRSAYEPAAVMFGGEHWRARLTRANLNPLEWRRRQLDRRYMRAAPAVVTHSQFTRRTLEEAYGVASTVLPLGVDAEAFRPGDGDRDGSVLSVGALHPLKGHDLVIDAVARLPERGRPPLTIIGDRGDAEAELRARAQRGGVALELLRNVPFAEVVRRYQRASVVACGQVREPFGLVPLEAMACATPVVAVRDGGFCETIADGQTGLLAERDAQAMAAALQRVLGDPELSGRLGRTGRAAVQEHWTWERSAEAFDAALTGVAARA